MAAKITEHTLEYPEGYEPDIIYPKQYGKYRFCLGKNGTDPLVAVCMNPSAAKETKSDMTINRIIGISKLLNKNGWIVFNLYPERATNAKSLGAFNQTILNDNIEIIKEYLINKNIDEIWAAWGDIHNIESLCEGKRALLSMLSEINVRAFYYGTLTKSLNPRHPLQRHEKINLTDKKYLDLRIY